MALGCFLARAGWDITMVDANHSKLEAGRRDGIALDGVNQSNVHFSAFADWTPPEHAILLLCTKTYDNPAVLSRATRRDLLIPVQNGFDRLLDASTHPFEGIASFVSQCEPDRPSTRITRAGDLHLGGRRKLSAPQRDILKNLASALRAGGCARVKIVESIAPYKSSKLMYNAAISPLAAASGIDNEQLLSDPLARRLFFALLRENYAILRRSGAALARIGPFHPSVVNLILSVPGLGRALARFFRPGLRGTYCSMVPDMGTGRTELDSYNGYLKLLDRDTACPMNCAVFEMMNTMNDQHLPPRREMLVQLGKSLGMEGVL